MLESAIWILLVGHFAGQVATRLKAPALVGMVLAGIALGPQLANVISPGTLAAADGLRTVAVMVILMKAGLGLDRDKLAQQGTVALRLGFLPAACEMGVVALIAIWLFQFDLATGLLLGCILGAESPAVIVPGMLRLKSLGWGVKKGIPDAILTGSALSDVLLLLLFSLLLAFLTQGSAPGFTLGSIVLSPVQLLPFKVILQITLGVVLGGLTAKGLVWLLARWSRRPTVVQDSLVAASLALLLVVVAGHIPVFSGYLAVMATGFFLIEFDPPLARRLRNGFNSLWIVAEIVLFVLLGASIQLQVLENTLWTGLLVLAVGTLLGRSLGWYLATLGSNWTPQEKQFLLAGNSAKATVQAAIGAIPLAQGIAGGETILALAALSILVTAPLGAWAIPTFAPRLLEQGKVDPTKVTVDAEIRLLVVVDRLPPAPRLLTKTAELARRCEGEVVVLLLDNGTHLQPFPQAHHQVYQQIWQVLRDIRHEVITIPAANADQMLDIARSHRISEIIHTKPDEAQTAGELLPPFYPSSIPVVLV
ncbi:MAG: cation:proton antiporter [Cyanobacteria bacterium P01_A01_bin.105]